MLAKKVLLSVVCVSVILTSVFAREDSVEANRDEQQRDAIDASSNNNNGTRGKRTIGVVLRNVADLFGYDVQKRPTAIPPTMAPAPAPAAMPAAMPAAAPAPMSRQAAPPKLPPPVTFPPILQEQDYYVRPGVPPAKQVDHPSPTQDISQFKKYYVKNAAPPRLQLPPIQIITQPPEAPLPVQEAARRPETTTARQEVVTSRYEEYNLPPQSHQENYVSYPSSTEIVVPSSTEIFYINPAKPRNMKLEREKTIVNKKESNNAYHTQNKYPNIIEHDYEVFNSIGPLSDDEKERDILRNTYDIIDDRSKIVHTTPTIVEVSDDFKKDYDYKDDEKKKEDNRKASPQKETENNEDVKKNYDYKDDAKKDYDYRAAYLRDYDDGLKNDYDLRVRPIGNEQNQEQKGKTNDDKKEPIDYDYVATLKKKANGDYEDENIETTEEPTPANVKAPVYDDYNEEQSDAPAKEETEEEDEESGEAREDKEESGEEQNDRPADSGFRFQIPYRDYDYNEEKKANDEEKEEVEAEEENEDEEEESSGEESRIRKTAVKAIKIEEDDLLTGAESKVVETTIKAMEARALEKFIVPTPSSHFFTFTQKSSDKTKPDKLRAKESKQESVKRKKEDVATIADLYAAVPKKSFKFDKIAKESKQENVKRNKEDDPTFADLYTLVPKKSFKFDEIAKESKQETVKRNKEDAAVVAELYAAVPKNPFKSEESSNDKEKSKQGVIITTTEEPDHFTYENPIEKEFKEEESRRRAVTEKTKEKKEEKPKYDVTDIDVTAPLKSPFKFKNENSENESVKVTTIATVTEKEPDHFAYVSPLEKEFKEEERKATTAKTPRQQVGESKRDTVKEKGGDSNIAAHLYALVPKNPFKEEKEAKEKEAKKKKAASTTEEEEEEEDEPDHFSYENPVEKSFKAEEDQNEKIQQGEGGAVADEETPDVEPENYYFSYKPRKKFTYKPPHSAEAEEDEEEEDDDKEVGESQRESERVEKVEPKKDKKKSKKKKKEYVDLSDFLKNYDNFDYLKKVHGEDGAEESRRRETKKSKEGKKKTRTKRSFVETSDMVASQSKKQNRFAVPLYPSSFFSDIIPAESKSENSTAAKSESANEEDEEEEEDEDDVHIEKHLDGGESAKYFDNYQIFKNFFKKSDGADDNKDEKEEEADEQNEEIRYPEFIPKLAEVYEKFDPEKRPDFESLRSSKQKGAEKANRKNDKTQESSKDEPSYDYLGFATPKKQQAKEPNPQQQKSEQESKDNPKKENFDKATKFDISYYQDPRIPDIPEFILEEERQEQEKLAKQRQILAQNQGLIPRIPQQGPPPRHHPHQKPLRLRPIVPVNHNEQQGYNPEEQRPRRVRVRRPRPRVKPVVDESSSSSEEQGGPSQAQASAVVESLSGIVPNQLHLLSKTDKSLSVPIPFDYDYASSDRINTVVPAPARFRFRRNIDTNIPSEYVPDTYTTDFTYTIPEPSAPQLDTRKLEQLDHEDDGPLSENARVYTTELGKLKGHLRASEDSTNF